MHDSEIPTEKAGWVKCAVILGFLATALTCSVLGYSVGLYRKPGTESGACEEKKLRDSYSSSSLGLSLRPRSWNDTVQELIGMYSYCYCYYRDYRWRFASE